MLTVELFYPIGKFLERTLNKQFAWGGRMCHSAGKQF